MRPEYKEIAREIGRNVRQRRLLAGLTQPELGAHLGITFQQVQKYENGSNQLSAIALYRLSLLLRCKPFAFFDGIEGGEASLPSSRRERLAGRLTRAVLAVESDEVQDALLHLLQAIARERHDPPR